MQFSSAIWTTMVATWFGFNSPVLAHPLRQLGADPLAADTVKIASVTAQHSRPLAVDVTVFQDEPLAIAEVTLQVASGMATFDSVSFAGGVYEPVDCRCLYLSPTVATVIIVPLAGDVFSPRSGLLCRLYLSYPLHLLTQTISLDTTTYIHDLIEHTTYFTNADLYTFRPIVLPGNVDISSTCCEGIRGNVDDSPDGVIDISDLSYLIAYLFLAGGQGIVCGDEADLDVPPDFVIDISDLSKLIDYLYINPLTGSLPPCPQLRR